MPSLRAFRRRRPGADPSGKGTIKGSMTLIEHLEELRSRLIVAMSAIAVGSVVGWFLYEPFKDLATGPYCDWIATQPPERYPLGCNLVFNGLLDAMFVKIKIVAFLGLTIALPVILWELWAFVVPGLTTREKRWAVPFIASSVVLFLAGGTVAFITLPKALDFLLGFAGEGVVPLITFDRYLGFVVLVALAFGVSFLFPVLLVFLELVGVLSTRSLRGFRRYAILVIAIFAAVITPSSDPYTMMAMMIPMYVFYEASIIIGRILNK
jgi:sec-independent protein translocase protein TatC